MFVKSVLSVICQPEWRSANDWVHDWVVLLTVSHFLRFASPCDWVASPCDWVGDWVAFGM
jgi:hypothetical protein